MRSEQRGETYNDAGKRTLLIACLPPRALRKTNNSGLQPALDYLQDHESSDGEDSDGEEANISVTATSGAEAEAKVSCLAALATVLLQHLVILADDAATVVYRGHVDRYSNGIGQALLTPP